MAWVAHYKYIIAVGINVKMTIVVVPQIIICPPYFKVTHFHVHVLFFVTVNDKVPQTW